MADRPTAPILDVDEKQDIKVFYHNVAYKTNRVVINVEKMKVCGHVRHATWTWGLWETRAQPPLAHLPLALLTST